MRDKRPEQAVMDRDFPAYAVVYLLEGGGYYQDRGRGRIAVAAGDCICVFPGLRHSYFRGDRPLWTEVFLVFGGPIFQALESEGLLDRDEPVWRCGLRPALIAAFDHLTGDFFAGRATADLLAARTHLLLAELRDAARAQAAGPRREDLIAVARARLEERPEQPLDLRQLARGLGLGYDRFRKLFTAAVGMPPARYRMLARVDRAKAMLAEGRLPLVEIARQLGYCDQYFFSRQFRAVAGTTPMRFRRQFGNP